MAVQLEFIDLIVPIGIIQVKYPGGFASFLASSTTSFSFSNSSCHLFASFVMRAFIFFSWPSLFFAFAVVSAPSLRTAACLKYFASVFSGASLV